MSDLYTVVVGEKGQITVPAELRKKYGITKGAVILVEDTGSKFSLVPTVVIPKYEFDWVEEDNLAEKDIKAGRVKRYSSSEYLNELENRINQQENLLSKETPGGKSITDSKTSPTKQAKTGRTTSE